MRLNLLECVEDYAYENQQRYAAEELGEVLAHSEEARAKAGMIATMPRKIDPGRVMRDMIESRYSTVFYRASHRG